MPSFVILMDAENKMPELRGATEAKVEKIGLLKDGMTSGRTSVVISLVMPDGSHVFAQTSLSLFMLAATAFNVQHMKDEANA